MAHISLGTTLNAFRAGLRESQKLVSSAQAWVDFLGRGSSRFTPRHEALVAELAFLRAFLAWEAFLEEAFILYLLGVAPPKGASPRRYAQPPNRKLAELMVAEGRDYADWTGADRVVKRAERFFREGEPFRSALRSRQSLLDDLRTLRNAIAHSSKPSQEKYERLVRRELATYPPSLAVGGFLAGRNPKAPLPESFFETYAHSLVTVAEAIVPS